MSSFFTDFFRAQLFANQNLMNSVSIRLVLFRQAPSLTDDLSNWTGYKTTAELNALPAWQELSGIPGYPLVTTLPVAKREIGINNYIIFTTYPFDDLDEPGPAAAIGVEFVGTVAGVVNPLIFVTNTPVGIGTNIFPGDALTANPDTENIPDSTNRYLFSWSDPPGGAPSLFPIEGPLTIFRAAPEFEPSNTLHLWLYPQRANMIANPSFEAPGVDYWAPAGVRVAGGAPGGGAWAGQFSGGIIESNVWPTLMGDEEHELWTFQLMAKGEGNLKIGLVAWDADYRGTMCDWGDETWELQTDAWIHVACVRYGPQAHTAMLRLECDGGGDVTIDRVLAEPGALKEWPYFDGDEKYGSPDAYSWYGGSTRQGKSYSMWYGDRRAVMGRLFATPTDTDAPDDVVTDDDVRAAGMVYNWVPAGVGVIPHIDVFYPGDLRTAPPLRSTDVLPYATDTTDGVTNPWV